MIRRHYLALATAGLLMTPIVTMAQSSGENSKSQETSKPEKRTPSSGATKDGTGGASEASGADTGAVTSAGDDTSAQGTSPPGQGEAAPAPGDNPASTAQRGTYTVRLRDLEDRINRLKEQIFRSKARLSLLAETVLDRKIAGAKATITFRNEMGGSFRLVKATFLLDGGPIFNKTDEGGSLAEREIINLYDGPVMPGDHTLSVVLHYRGHGYGIFSYLKGYSFKTRSSRSFTVNEGKVMKLDVVGYESGGVTTPLEERPDVRYVMGVDDYDMEAESESAGENEKK